MDISQSPKAFDSAWGRFRIDSQDRGALVALEFSTLQVVLIEDLFALYLGF